jgi:hypothetical protein
MSKGTERLVFKFDFSLRDYIQDVVHSGTHGHFTEARLLAHNSLEQFDKVFPIALEIMRLMYDQGDVDALHSYIDLRVQTHGKSWTAKALCIVHLMHDTCERSCDKLAELDTTPYDWLAANRNLGKFEDLDDEQVSFCYPYTIACGHNSHTLDFRHSAHTQNGIHWARKRTRASDCEISISPYHIAARQQPLPIR